MLDRPTSAQDAANGPVDAASPLMYAAGFCVMLCAVTTAILGLELRDPMFGATIVGMAALGFSVSLAARSRPSAGWALAAAVGSGLGLLALVSSSGGALEQLFPSSGSGDVHRDLGVFLCWLLVLLSFAQLSRGWLLFMCVPAAAIMGLVGTVYAEPAFLWLFLAFVVLGTFMVVHDQYARMRIEPKRSAGPTRDGSSLVGQLYVVAACSAAAIIVGRIIAQPMQTVGSTLVPISAVAGTETGPDQRRQTPRVAVSESSELLIGGGPETESDTVLMRIRAEHGSYWRGATFDWYTGSGWRSTLRPNISVGPRASRGVPSALFDPRMRDSVEILVPRTNLNETPGRTHTLRQYVRLEGAGRFTDLYGASEPRLYRLMDTAGFGLPLSAFADETGRVALNRPIGATYYEVESEVVEWSPDELRRASESIPDAILDAYTPVVISGGPERLRELAMEITRGADNRYDRVEALRQYLSRTCLYNLEAPPITGALDVVSSFVFDTRQGECKLFASALAVLCRTIGIPARVASGFLSGEFDPDYQYHVVRERDKHLWTEVYFAGYGWIAFDATTDARDVTPRDDGVGIFDERGWIGTLLRRGWVPPVAVALGIILLAYVLVMELVIKRLGRRTCAPTASLDPSTARLLHEYARLSKKLRRRGLSRKPYETPAEYEVRLRALLNGNPEAQEALRVLTQTVVEVRYGMAHVTAADAVEVRRRVGAVLQGLEAARRAVSFRPAPAGART